MKSPIKGFTLVELLLVVAIASIISAVILAAINPAKSLAQARDSGRIADIKQIANALHAYQALKGQFPSECSVNGGIDSSVGSNCVGGGLGSIDGWELSSSIYTTLIGEGFLKTLPKDSINDIDRGFFYFYELGLGACSGTTCGYWIGAFLESPKSALRPIFRCTNIAPSGSNFGLSCKEVGSAEFVSIFP